MYFDSVIFDFDFTLADGTDAIAECYNYAFRKLGYPEAEREPVRITVGMTVMDSAEYLTGCHDKETLQKMFELFRDKADEVLVKGTKFLPGSLELLRRLKREKIGTAIVSSKDRLRIDGIFDLHGGSDCKVDTVIGYFDAPEPKPSPCGVFEAVKRLCAKNPLYVGDSLIDLNTAANAGYPFAAVTTGTTKKEDFLKEAEDKKVRLFGIFGNIAELEKALFSKRTLYITDIDGTLRIGTKKVSEESSKLINEATENGAFFTVATARGIASTKYVLQDTKPTAPLVCLSGAELYDTEKREAKRYTLPEIAVIAACDTAKDIGADLFVYYAEDGSENLYICHNKPISESAKRFIEMRSGIDGQIFTEENPPKNAKPLYLVAISDKEKTEKIYKAVSEKTAVSTDRFLEKATNTEYLEIFSEKGGKGNAVDRLKKELFITHTVAFGDNHNDISMKQYADEFYTVENAVDEVKKVADGVLQGENAVAKFIYQREKVGFPIQNATISDITELSKLDKENFAEGFSENQIATLVEREVSEVKIVKENGAILAYIMSDLYPDGAEILKIYTSPILRRLGIAKHFTDGLVSSCKAKNIERILLEVRSKNPALRFYENYGFNVDGIRKGYYKNPADDAVLMSYPLTKEKK